MSFLLVLLLETGKSFISDSEMEMWKLFPWDAYNKDASLQLVL